MATNQEIIQAATLAGVFMYTIDTVNQSEQDVANDNSISNTSSSSSSSIKHTKHLKHVKKPWHNFISIKPILQQYLIKQ